MSWVGIDLHLSGPVCWWLWLIHLLLICLADWLSMLRAVLCHIYLFISSTQHKVWHRAGSQQMFVE